MDRLPSEILIQVLFYLPVEDIKNFQRTSHRFLEIGRDATTWREACFEKSWYSKKPGHMSYYSSSSQRSQRLATVRIEVPHATRASNRNTTPVSPSVETSKAIANWDPSYQSEQVDWYQEYIHRNAKPTIRLLPYIPLEGARKLEDSVRGFAVYNEPMGGSVAPIAVCPMQDGSLKLWRLPRRKKNPSQEWHYKRPINTTRPGLLRSEQVFRDRAFGGIDTYPILDCIKVDSKEQKAYVAVGSVMNCINLRSLEVMSRTAFDEPICALSEVNSPNEPTQLTVSTKNTIFLFDSRVEASKLQSVKHDGGIQCIHHPQHQTTATSPHEIFASGRIQTILNYDRRKFERPVYSFISKGRLSTLSSMPFPYNCSISNRRQRNDLSPSLVHRYQTMQGSTLIASGEYGGRGSLELYNLGSRVSRPTDTYWNRQSTSHGKVLSHATHGTRIVYTDSYGMIWWKERNASTDVRQIDFWAATEKPSERDVQSNSRIGPGIGMANPWGVRATDPVADMLLRKVAVVDQQPDDFNAADLVIWAGEQIAQVSFAKWRKNGRGFQGQNEMQTDEEDRKREQYVQEMNQAMRIHDNERMAMQRFGLG